MLKRALAMVGFLMAIIFISGCTTETTGGNLLPDLTGKTQTEVETILENYPYSLVIKTEENLSYPTGTFIRYGNDLDQGDSLAPGSVLQIYFALNRLRLPDLANKTEAQIQTLFEAEDVTLIFETEINMEVETGLFSRFGNDFQTGDPVDFGATLTIYLADNDETLPVLSGLNETESTTLLEATTFEYTIVFEEDLAKDNGLFSRYANDLQGGQKIRRESEITVYFVLNYPRLPDLSGMDMSEISLLMRDQPFSFQFKDETNNQVEDGTFSRYGNDLEAGDAIANLEQVIDIYIGFNVTFLPDLSGKLKGEIHQILTDLNISYEFVDVIDDEFEESSFQGYETGYEAGDEAPSSRIVVYVYKNTFTSAETSLFISKYVDGGGTNGNQAIEIYNPLGSAINLADYHLAIYTNGSWDESYLIPLGTGELVSKATFVIVYQEASSELKDKADLLTSDLVFDGNDVIQLRYKNNTYIDTIYPIGSRNFLMDDEVFIRKPDIDAGTRDFKLQEWTAYLPTYVASLGSHPVEIPLWPTFEFIDRPFRDPLGGTVLVDLVTVNDGDTAGFNDALTDEPTYAGSERVRFLGIDTPETYPTSQPWGPEAKNFTTGVLYSADIIYLQSDPALGFTETYGRHLALVWVDNYSGTEGMMLLNYELVRLGYSYNYLSSDCSLIFNNRYLYRWFQDAELEAKANSRGIHS